GKLGFILPDSLLALSNRKIIRKYIMETTKIKKINHVGEKFENLNVSNIILILEKEQSDKGRFHNYVKIKTPKHEIKLQQWRFKEWNYKFLINLNETDISILAYLNDNFPKLGELNENYRIDMKIQRGVEIGKDGTVFYCSQCKKYYPLPSRRRDLICKVCKTPFQESHIESIVFDEKPKNSEAEFVPFIYTISRYQINQRKYITTSKQGINYKSFDLYQDRILIRQISEDNKICATYDRGLSLTTQSIYNLKIKQYENNHLFNSYYLLGLLNSELLSYYFIKSFGSYKLLFPRILIEKIRQLPILIPETQKEKKIAEKLSKCVKEVLELSDNNKGSRDYQKKLNLIDELTYELFSIQKKTYIHSFFLK
ncbi:MAG: TaqI-like C-terminal specificity domain-containing protein, partial [Promethearchaeia archaeon]